MSFFRRSTKGFTLVEMILYVSLCSIMLLVISTMLSYLLSSRVKSQAITEVNQQGFQIMYSITQTIRNGRSIQVPSLGTSSSTLSLTVANTLLNPTVFSVSSSTFFIQEGGKAPIALTNSRVKASSLVFQNISSSSSSEKVLRVSFVLDAVNPEGRGEYSFTKTFSGSATLR